MKVTQNSWYEDKGWATAEHASEADLVLTFATTDILGGGDYLANLNDLYPKAHIVGCTTAGEILGTEVRDEGATVTAVKFDGTPIVTTKVDLAAVDSDSVKAGESLADALPRDGLKHVLIISDGLNVNGDQLVEGLSHVLGNEVGVTGGLAGDAGRFEKTFVSLGRDAFDNGIVAIGFYGDKIDVGCGSMGGWDPFGPQRLVTKAEGKVLYELDNVSALSVYKDYLGEKAAELPSSALLFPLSLTKDPTKGWEHSVVRTILAIDEEQESMTFAGDIPEGYYAQFMKANFDKLIDGAETAAQTSIADMGANHASLGLLISCVGRKLVLKQRTEEEAEAVQDVLGTQAHLTGFYSYGEICPFESGKASQLHNQTMTITVFKETT